MNPSHSHAPKRVTLRQYIHRRNGVPLGASGSLRNMLHRSLGAGSFAGFWRYWNPVWGYALGRYVYQPLKRVLPSNVALVLMFVICGAIHDLATLAFRGATDFVFAFWFLLLGSVAVAGRAVKMDLSRRTWLLRAALNLTYLGTCLAVTLIARRWLVGPG